MGKFFHKHKKKIQTLFILAALSLLFFFIPKEEMNYVDKQPAFWKFRAIDTMKYSRDVSREKLNDASFDVIIDRQVSQIAGTGATHVAIATPYDEEFIPILKRWVKAARKYGLNVWFRGNWSGWEGWFGYPKIGREEHIQKTEAFILDHPELFIDGDVFSACPECENGGPGDPRMNGDAAGHRKFLIDEYKMTKAAFKKISKNIASNYDSMNGDVAKLIMDRETTKALDGIVTVDHYVRTPEQLVSDIKYLAEQSGGKVVLGEFGAPIPDIHGNMTEEQQALWIREALGSLIQTEELVGVSYWTNVGSSTELWNGEGTPRKVVEELKKVFNPTFVKIAVKNELGRSINNATLISGGKIISAKNGTFLQIYLHEPFTVDIAANGYVSQKLVIDQKDITIILKKQHEDIIFKLQKWVSNLF